MASSRNHRSVDAVCGVVLLLAFCQPACGALFAGGTGEPNDPYEIATAEQLIAIGSDPNLLAKHFVLIQDIDLDPNLPGGRVFDSALSSRARIVWTHAGRNFYCDPFTGSFDGNGHTIRNLTIHAEGDLAIFLGLFGQVEGRVENVRLERVNISGRAQVGAVAGNNQGTIFGCSVSGIVTGQSGIGAVVGASDGLVSCCYATGQVRGDATVGGLIGSQWEGALAFSYSTAQVSGNPDAGGLIGACGYKTTTYLSYWDVDASGVQRSAGGRGKHTHEMMARGLYRGWGYPGVWVLADGIDYPRLSWEAAAGQPIVDPPSTYGGGTGEPNTPFEIRTPEQLVSISYHPGDFNDCFMLMDDIDMNEVDPNLLLPIGTERWPFAGQFEGNDHTISNLACLLEGYNYVGLFGYMAERWYNDPAHEYYRWVTVKNVHLENVAIRGGECTGALIGLSKGAVEFCTATGVVAGSNRTGGLIGDNQGRVRDCHYSGDVNGRSYTGGLCGRGATMSSCSATGTVKGVSYVGGLAGSRNLGELASCHAQSQVTGAEAVGGLVGSNDGWLRDSYSISSVTGQTRVGGLVGSHRWGDIERCTCSGEVLGDTRVGGLVGYNSRWTIASCYATATVTGHSAVGGLVGHNDEGAARYSYAAGTVIGDGDDVGGLVGFSQGEGKFLLCLWDVEASGVAGGTPHDLAPQPAGVTGKTTAQMQMAATFIDAGWDFENVWMICEGIDYPRLRWQQVDCGPDH